MCIEHPFMELRNPIEEDGAEKIVQLDAQSYRVTMKDGGVFEVDSDQCSCGHERDYTPSRSASFEQSYRERRNASCAHQRAVLNSKKVGACEECGNRVVRKSKMHHMGRHVMDKFMCANCGAKIGMK